MRLQDPPSQEGVEPSPSPTSPASSVAHDGVEAHGLYRLGLAYGRFIYRARWFVIALWLIALVASAPFAARLPSVLSGGGYTYAGSESTRVGDIMAQTLHLTNTTLLVVLHSDSVAVSDPAYQSEAHDIVSRVQGFDGVTGVSWSRTAPNGATTYPTGQDGRTTYLTVTFDRDEDYVEKHLGDFTRLLPQGADAGPARIYVTGSPAVYHDFTVVTQRDVEYAEGVALPIALVILLLVFGTLLSAITPLLLTAIAVPVALAIIYSIAVRVDTSVFVLNIASAIGLGISIDYSLFMVRRFRDELARGRNVRDAVGWTVATAGEAIFFSGLTVMIGFAGIMLMGVPFLNSIGYGGAAVVGSAALAALTLLPAWLGVLGPRINALRVPVVSRFVGVGRASAPAGAAGGAADDETRGGGGYWRRLALGVMRHPVLVIVLVTALLLGLGWPILSLNIGTPSSTALPASSEARAGLDILNAQFPQTKGDPIYITVQTPDGSSIQTADTLTRLDDLTNWLARQRHVTSVTSLTRLPQVAGVPALSAQQLIALYTSGQLARSPQYAPLAALAQSAAPTVNDTTLVTVTTDAKVDSAEGKALIDTLRAGDRDAAEGLRVQVGGFQAASLDFTRYLYGNFPRTILFIVGATFLLLLLMFRSLLLPIKAIVMNALSVCVAYGVLVYVFQQGHGEQLLHFTSEGFLESTIPVLLFCILFGLSMDYEVFLLSRIREEWLRTRNNTQAVALGLEKTGGVITNAALLFVIVTGALTFSTIVTTQEMGLGMTVAVLVDAAIIRTLLVPATMRLLGRWNWWLPGRPVPVERKA